MCFGECLQSVWAGGSLSSFLWSPDVVRVLIAAWISASGGGTPLAREDEEVGNGGREESLARRLDRGGKSSSIPSLSLCSTLSLCGGTRGSAVASWVEQVNFSLLVIYVRSTSEKIGFLRASLGTGLVRTSTTSPHRKKEEGKQARHPADS